MFVLHVQVLSHHLLNSMTSSLITFPAFPSFPTFSRNRKRVLTFNQVLGSACATHHTLSCTHSHHPLPPLLTVIMPPVNIIPILESFEEVFFAMLVRYLFNQLTV
jgi:hypothetical protein